MQRFDCGSHTAALLSLYQTSEALHSQDNTTDQYESFVILEYHKESINDNLKRNCRSHLLLSLITFICPKNDEYIFSL